MGVFNRLRSKFWWDLMCCEWTRGKCISISHLNSCRETFYSPNAMLLYILCQPIWHNYKRLCKSVYKSFVTAVQYNITTSPGPGANTKLLISIDAKTVSFACFHRSNEYASCCSVTSIIYHTWNIFLSGINLSFSRNSASRAKLAIRAMQNILLIFEGSRQMCHHSICKFIPLQLWHPSE